MKHALLASGLLVVCGACGGGVLDPIVKAAGDTDPTSVDGGSGDGGIGVDGPVVTPNPSCKGKESAANEIIIACGFGPDVAVLGATSDHVVVMTLPESTTSKIYRIHRTTSVVEELNKRAHLAAGVSAFVFSAQAKSVTYSVIVEEADGFSFGLAELDVARNTTNLLRSYGVGRAFHSNATHAFYLGDSSEPGLHRVARTDGMRILVADTDGTPIRELGPWLYFTDGASGETTTLKRVPSAGGAVESVLTNIPRQKGLVAIDDDGAAFYPAPRDSFGGWRLVRNEGGTTNDIYDCADPELCSAPSAVFVEGSRAFVRLDGRLLAFPKAGVQGPQTQGRIRGPYLGTSTGHPWLEGDHVIYARSAGGADTPYEGVVAVQTLE